MSNTIVILEDEESISNVIRLVAKKYGFDAKTYSDVEDMISNIEVLRDCKLFITDFNLHSCTSIPVLYEMNKLDIHPYTILNTGNPNAMKYIYEANLSNMINEYSDKTINFNSFFKKLRDN